MTFTGLNGSSGAAATDHGDTALSCRNNRMRSWKPASAWPEEFRWFPSLKAAHVRVTPRGVRCDRPGSHQHVCSADSSSCMFHFTPELRTLLKPSDQHEPPEIQTSVTVAVGFQSVLSGNQDKPWVLHVITYILLLHMLPVLVKDIKLYVLLHIIWLDGSKRYTGLIRREHKNNRRVKSSTVSFRRGGRLNGSLSKNWPANSEAKWGGVISVQTLLRGLDLQP